MKNSQTEVLIQNSRVKKEISEKSPKRTSQIQSKFTQAGVHTLLWAGWFLALAGWFPGIALGCYVWKTAFGWFQGYKLWTRIYDIWNQRIQKIYAPKNPPKTTPKLRKIIGAVGVAVMLVLWWSHIASASAETVLDIIYSSWGSRNFKNFSRSSWKYSKKLWDNAPKWATQSWKMLSKTCGDWTK
jgi:hypothetical protein